MYNYWTPKLCSNMSNTLKCITILSKYSKGIRFYSNNIKRYKGCKYWSHKTFCGKSFFYSLCHIYFPKVVLLLYNRKFHVDTRILILFIDSNLLYGEKSTRCKLICYGVVNCIINMAHTSYNLWRTGNCRQGFRLSSNDI